MIKVADQEKRKNEPPIDKVLDMQERGLSNDEIIKDLQREGYSYQEIFEALNQSDIKSGISPGSSNAEFDMPTLPEAPSLSMRPSMMGRENIPEEVEREEIPPMTEQVEQPMMEQTIPLTQSSRGVEEQIEEIAESIIDEKWQRVTEEVGDLGTWKENVRRDIVSVKQELIRFEDRFENLQKSVLGKVKEYDKGVSDIGIEIKVLEKVLKDIIKPLTVNVRELSRLTKEIKKR